jgi:hypothetical protein
LECAIRQHLQDEDAEANADRARTTSNLYKVHDQDAGPETSLEAIHGEEGPGLERIAEEEYNRKDVKQQDDDDEQHEDDD